MDASKRLIPYSVHLTPEIYAQLKELAKERKASKMVRDAIAMIISGNDEFTSGYNKGLRDAMDLIHKDELAGTVSVNNKRIADHLIDQIEGLINEP